MTNAYDAGRTTESLRNNRRGAADLVAYLPAGSVLVMDDREAALRYHREGRRGKIEVCATKATRTQRDLALAYSPGVAEPCREIAADISKSFEYTARGNLVAVITNGTAVLGLGDIGPAASKPVMEGKGVLFKRFADIDVFDLEVDAKDPDEFVRIVSSLGAGFGGINLEDIKAPECYEIEERLRAALDIPVFHDDQHGTAIITSAALLNALELTGRSIADTRIVICGAGAAALSCGKLFVSLGVDAEKIIVTDSRGVIYRGREQGMNRYKESFAANTDRRTLAEAMVGADVFVGLSTGGIVSAEMVRSMADAPIIFALANPDPEISYPDATAARPDAIVGTGRSDFPNQINNVLGFPFIFRGALDVRARSINEEMKLAAVEALANLAKEDVPDSVSEAYGERAFCFGREYLIPKPLDPRALVHVSCAVARAAIESGVAREPLDLDEYSDRLEKLLGHSSRVMRTMFRRARKGRRSRIVFADGDDETVLHACQRILTEDIAEPVLIGDVSRVRDAMKSIRWRHAIDRVTIIDPAESERREAYRDRLYGLRKYKGLSRDEAERLSFDPTHFGVLMVEQDDADGMVSGLRHHYSMTLRAALQIVRCEDWLTKASGLFLMSIDDRLFFFADTTVNIDPSPSELAEIAICAAEAAQQFGANPRVAMLSYSNPGASQHPRALKVKEAVAIARERYPDLAILGEMQADAAIDPILRSQRRAFNSGEPAPQAGSGDDRPANVLIFPDLDAANIAYKLLIGMGHVQAIGPIVLGMRKPINVIPHGFGVEDIVNLTAITAVQSKKRL